MRYIIALLLALLPLPAAAQNLTTGNFGHFITSSAQTSTVTSGDYTVVIRNNQTFRIPAINTGPAGGHVHGLTGEFGNALFKSNSNTLQADSAIGQVAFATSTYSSDNTSGPGGATILLYETSYNDSVVDAKTLWGGYDETHVTKQANVVETIGRESSMYNRGASVGINPYVTNIVGLTENRRYDCGIGAITSNITASSSGKTLTITAVSSGGPYNGMVITAPGIAADTELIRQLTGNINTGIGTWETSVANTVGSEAMALATDAKTCSAAIHIIGNGARYWSGIVFADDPINGALVSLGNYSDAITFGEKQAIVWTKPPNGDTTYALWGGAELELRDLIAGPNILTTLNHALYLGEVGVAGVIIGGAGGDDKGDGTLNIAKGVYINGVLTISGTAPTIGSGGCTTGSAQSISAANGSAAFAITLGGATCGSTITLTMPAAQDKWVCDAHDITTPASNVVEQSAAANSTSVELTNYVRTTGVAGNFTAADVILVKCTPY